MSDKIRLGVSACLLGERVRYDGQHKHDRFITDTLGRFVEYVPVCPEVECGLPVPREAMRLVGSLENPRLMTQRSGIDLTEQMQSWVNKRVKELEKEKLCGFIFKAKSPSSGMERVKVYNGRGGLTGFGSGMFARAFMAHFPLLPVEEEGRLHDPLLRENFIERIFTLQRYRAAITPRISMAALTGFHAYHKYLLMSHSQEAVRQMGRMLANAKRDGVALKALAANYEEALLTTLKLIATPRKHVNVLQHMAGYLKEELAADEKKELAELLAEFKQGLIPLIVPVTIINHYVRKYQPDYLKDQVYLQPHPLELQLRNHS